MHRVYQLGQSQANGTESTVEYVGHGTEVRLERVVVRDEDELIDLCADADGLIPMGAEPITRRVMESLGRLKVVARGGVGVDAVDVDAATELGIQVTNAPDSNYRDVALHALAMILHLVRGIGVFDGRVRGGDWDSSAYASTLQRPEALQLGIVGMGRSGTEVARLGGAIGFDVATHVRPGRESAARAAGVTPMPLDELVSTSDIVSLHIGLDSSSRHIVDAALLDRFRHGAMLVNVSRGGLVDHAALEAALASGRIGGAALDVFPSEPLPADSSLLQAPNTVFTPHVAYLSVQSLQHTITTAVSDAVSVLEGRPPVNPVNRIDPRS